MSSLASKSTSTTIRRSLSSSRRTGSNCDWSLRTARLRDSERGGRRGMPVIIFLASIVAERSTSMKRRRQDGSDRRPMGTRTAVALRWVRRSAIDDLVAPPSRTGVVILSIGVRAFTERESPTAMLHQRLHRASRVRHDRARAASRSLRVPGPLRGRQRIARWQS
jgi:hypothetical protein